VPAGTQQIARLNVPAISFCIGGVEHVLDETIIFGLKHEWPEIVKHVGTPGEEVKKVALGSNTFTTIRPAGIN
jgi:hypothetical protein